MLHFEGTRDFARPPADVWAKLTDARFLVDCIPGVESVTRAEPDQAVCVLRPGFAFVRGTLELTLQVVDRVPDTSCRVLAHSKGIGTTSEVEALLRIAPKDGSTQLLWTADIKQLGGLLKAVPHGLIKASAQKVIADAWTAVDAKLNR
jgi:carbon monoxide dehydrogenase subunit G